MMTTGEPIIVVARFGFLDSSTVEHVNMQAVCHGKVDRFRRGGIR
jgi:hypothetical protein